MQAPVIAIYDANVLYPAPLRDLLIRVAQAGLVRARWTEAIHDEWLRSVLKSRPQLSAERLARTRELMNAAVRDCVVTGYETLVESLTLPDPDDRHVLAAAVRAGAEVIVTCNLADFPAATLAGLGIEAQHPDHFLTALLDLSPDEVYAAAKQQRMSLRNPPKTVEELLTAFEQQGISQFATRLREHIELL